MGLCRPRPALFFEELEPRLLFSADFAGVDTEVVEQDYAEEPVITADLESTLASEDTAAADADGTGALQAEDKGTAEPDEPATDDEMEIIAGDSGAVEETDESAGLSGTKNPHAASDSGEDAAVPLAEAEPENSAPVLTQPDGPVDCADGEQPILIAPAATVTDADSDNFQQGTLTVSISAGGSDGDQLSIAPGGDVTLINSNIKVEQKLVGSFAGGTDGMALVISWSPQATPDDAEAVLRQMAYSHDSTASTGERTVDFVLTDGDGGTSNTLQSIINVTDGVGEPGDSGQGDGEEAPGENTPPVLAQPGGPLEYLDGGQPLLIASTAKVVDLDSADFKQGTLTVNFSQGGGSNDQLVIAPGGNVTLLNNNIKVEQKLVGSFAGGTDGTALVISWSPQATPAYAEAVLRQIAYSNGSTEPILGSRTVDFVLTDGDGGISNTVTSIINVTAAGLPGSGPGPGEGDSGDDGDTGGGEVVPPIEEPIDEPVDEQDDTPDQPTPGDDEQNIPEGGQEGSSGNDGSEAWTPPVVPVIEPVVPEKMVLEATDGSRFDFQPATGEWPDGTTSVGEIRGEGDPADNDSHAAPELENIFFATGNGSVPDVAASSPEGVFGYENEAGGYACSLPEQPSAAAGQGQEIGDVSHEELNSETMRTTIARLIDFFAPSTAIASPFLPVTTDPADDGDTPAHNEKISRDVEIMRQEMEEAYLQSTKADRLMVYTTTGASLSLAAGITRYFLQSGSLLSGFLATIPLWKGFDPVAVLSTPKNGRMKSGSTSPSADFETVDLKAETMFGARGEA